MTLNKKFIFSLLIIIPFCGYSQNRIELNASDCSQENGFTMFQLNRAMPKILPDQKFEEEKGYWSGHKKIIQNQSDTLRIEFTNIYGQTIDTTFTNAKELSKISICVDKFKDYERKSLIKEAIQNNKKWILNSSWGHQTFESDKLILKPKKEYLKYKYYKEGKRVKSGKIKITDYIVERISLFERKMNLMKEADNSCNFGINFNLSNGSETLKVQDDSCSGFSNQQLLTDLKITE